jgi:hypothetical protein
MGLRYGGPPEAQRPAPQAAVLDRDRQVFKTSRPQRMHRQRDTPVPRSPARRRSPFKTLNRAGARGRRNRQVEQDLVSVGRLLCGLPATWPVKRASSPGLWSALKLVTAPDPRLVLFVKCEKGGEPWHGAKV